MPWRTSSTPAPIGVTQWNLRIAGEVVELLLPFVADAHRERVAALATAAGAAIAPVRDALRVQVIHGDISDDNVVASGDEITGVIDFGDVATSWTVAELAVTCAAVLHHDPRDPLAVLEVIAGFAEVLPLPIPSSERSGRWCSCARRCWSPVASSRSRWMARRTGTPTRTAGTNGSRSPRRRDSTPRPCTR